jgi:hypothetical protein
MDIKKMTPLQITGLVITIAVIIGSMIFLLYETIYLMVQGFSYNVQDYKNSPDYQNALKIVSELADVRANPRQAMDKQVATVPENQNCFVNFEVLSCRFTGYLGPFVDGFFDIQTATTNALRSGCRCLVLEIDYLDDCGTLFPQLVVRDVQGKSQARGASLNQPCDSLPIDPNTSTIPTKSTIFDVATVIANTAFGYTPANGSDPVIIVLYFLRTPPANMAGDNSQLLDFYKGVAQGLKPLLRYSIDNIGPGGTFARQAQELTLLTNDIRDYKNHCLFFSNVDTSVFRGTNTPTNLDLDYIVNLRLVYNQAQLGATTHTLGNPNASKGGILDTVESYKNIDPQQIGITQKSTQLTWTMNLAADPSVVVPNTDANYLFNTIGTHSLPIQIWAPGYGYMFTDSLFKTYSYMAKPKGLRYTRPDPATGTTQSPAANAKGGALQTPTV